MSNNIRWREMRRRLYFFIITTKKCSKYLYNTKICSTFVVS